MDESSVSCTQEAQSVNFSQNCQNSGGHELAVPGGPAAWPAWHWPPATADEHHPHPNCAKHVCGFAFAVAALQSHPFRNNEGHVPVLSPLASAHCCVVAHQPQIGDHPKVFFDKQEEQFVASEHNARAWLRITKHSETRRQTLTLLTARANHGI